MFGGDASGLVDLETKKVFLKYPAPSRGRRAVAADAWATKRGAVQVNPFANLPVAKSITRRERVLSDRELAEVWQGAGEAAAPYGTLIRLLILTGQRRSEVAAMTWAELSDDLTTHTRRAYQKWRHPCGAPQRTSPRVS